MISELVPYIEGTTQIDIEWLGTVLTSVSAGPATPSVTVTTPNGGETLTGDTITVAWTANDPDNDPLVFNVQYSPDNGVSWEMIAQNISGNSVELDASNIVGGAEARFRVWVSDGIHTASDESDAPFTVPNHIPTAEILEPEDGTTLVISQTLGLVGNAYDIDIGSMDESQLQWISSIDGVLGNGPQFSTADLSPGTHTITFQADDGQGGIASDSIQVTVLADIALAPSVPDTLVAGPSFISFDPKMGITSAVISVDNQNVFNPISWNASVSESWLQLSATSGNTPQDDIIVTLDKAKLAVSATNLATITFTSPETPGEETIIRVSVQVPDLAISKDDGQTTASPGQTLTYELIINNISNQDANGVTVIDILPEHATFVAASDGGNLSGNMVTWPAFDLEAGLSAVRTITVQVDSPIPNSVDTLTNTATVADDGTGGPDPTPNNNTVTDIDTILIPCQIYAVSNTSNRDSQFLTIDFTTLEGSISAPGLAHPDANIQGLEVHPQTNELFASTGDHGNGTSQLYKVSPMNGDMTLVGTIRDDKGNRFEEVTDLSFQPDGTLWGFAAKGPAKRRGLITIDPATGIARLVEPSKLQVEGLAWTPDGSVLWLATQNKLHIYTPGGTIKEKFTASGLPGNIKGLEFRHDGKLMISMHFGGGVNIYVLDANSGQLATIDSFETPDFKDVTALTWPDGCDTGLPEISGVLKPEVNNALSYLDNDGHGVQISIPANTLSAPSRFSYVDIKTNTTPPDMNSAGHIFRLNLYQDGIQLHNSTFQPPITIRVDYDDTDVAGLDKDTLGLYYWDREGGRWLSAICDNMEYERHPDQNWLSLPVCHLTEFGLFGAVSSDQGGGAPNATEKIYLPIILSNDQ